MVERQSAILGLALTRELQVAVDADHSDIGKFAGDDNRYRVIAERIKTVLDRAPKFTSLSAKDKSAPQSSNAAQDTGILNSSLNPVRISSMLSGETNVLTHPGFNSWLKQFDGPASSAGEDEEGPLHGRTSSPGPCTTSHPDELHLDTGNSPTQALESKTPSEAAGSQATSTQDISPEISTDPATKLPADLRTTSAPSLNFNAENSPADELIRLPCVKNGERVKVIIDGLRKNRNYVNFKTVEMDVAATNTNR